MPLVQGEQRGRLTGFHGGSAVTEGPVPWGSAAGSAAAALSKAFSLSLRLEGCQGRQRPAGPTSALTEVSALCCPSFTSGSFMCFHMATARCCPELGELVFPVHSSLASSPPAAAFPARLAH